MRSLISQHCTASFPSPANLGEAVLWDYTFTLDLDGDVAIEVTFNDDPPVRYAMAIEDGGVRVTPAAEAMVDGSRCTVVFRRLNVLHVQQVRVSVGGVAFQEGLTPMLQSDARIEIGGTRAPLASHLQSLLQRLLADSPFASQSLSIECRYGHSLAGLPLEAPVLLVARQDVNIGFDELLVEEMAGAIQQWLDAVQPPRAEARLILGLTFWKGHGDRELLRLTNVSLGMEDVG